MKQPVNVAITGAAGQIGYALAFRVASGAMLGADQPVNLHLLELLGGWPGAFLAQRRLRHKCSKGSYQFVFWLIVLGYQFAAYDSLQHWQYSRAGLNWIERASKEPTLPN